MTEREERDLAWRLADGMDAVDFEIALQFVRSRPAEAEELIRIRDESLKQLKELARTNERLRRAALGLR